MRQPTRLLLTTFLLWVTAAPLFGQSAATSEARQGIRAMFDSLNAAARRRDRAALEQVYAEEFLFVHATGGIVTRREQLDGIMNRAATGPGIPVPPLDSLRVHGDIAVLRSLEANRFGTSIWVRRDARWQIALIQGTMIPARSQSVAVDARRLVDFVGRYLLDSGFVVVSVERDSLMVQRATGPRLAVRPIGDDQFEDRFGARLTFTRDAAGAVTQFVYRTAVGAERIWKRAR